MLLARLNKSGCNNWRFETVKRYPDFNELGYFFSLVSRQDTLNRHCRKNLASLNVEFKRKYGIKIDGQILVIYPSKFLY